MTQSLDADTFDGLVSGFYTAAVGETTWSSALDAVQVAFRARAVALQTIDLSTSSLLSLHHGGPDLDDCIYNYVRTHHLTDPRRPNVIARGEGADLSRWVHYHEVFDAHFVNTNPFYRQFLAAYEMRYSSAVPLPVSPGVISVLVIESSPQRGALDASELEFAARMSAHLEEALRMHEQVRRIAAQAAAGHDLLHNFVCPMWLLDTDRYVYHANPSAQREQQKNAHAALRGERLVLRSTPADRELTQRLHALGNARHGERAVINLRRTESDPPTWLHLQMLQPNAVLGAFGTRPLVLATLYDPAQVQPLDPLALADIFGLTPAEARVAALLAEGLTAKEVGQRIGVLPTTVRSHQRQILVKLGVERTNDVVRLLRQGEALWALAT